MPRHTSQAMIDALQLVLDGENPHAAAKRCGLLPSSVYCKLARIYGRETSPIMRKKALRAYCAAQRQLARERNSLDFCRVSNS